MTAPIPPGEFGYIGWILNQLEAGVDVVVEPGDDCAVVRVGDELVAVTTDMLLGGTHFDDSTSPRDVGYKTVAVSLSDLAAMGAIPRYALTALGLPTGAADVFKAELVAGLREAADAFGLALIGGDITAFNARALGSTTAGGQPLLVTCLTAIGVMAGANPMTRAGARPGDAVFVTGALGGSLLGKHARFTPRVREGRWLAERGTVTACIDISDGLSSDIGHICDRSQVGVDLIASAIPISAAAHQASERSGHPAFHHALNDGEDFELLFTLTSADADEIQAAWPFLDTPLHGIGSVVDAELGRRLLADDRSAGPIEPAGFDQLRQRDP